MYSYIDLILIYPLLFLSIESYIIERPSCLSEKCPVNKNVIFKSGHSYIYNYHVDIVANKIILNNTVEIDKVHFDSVVEIQTDEECNLIMKFQDTAFIYSNEREGVNMSYDNILGEILIFRFEEGKVTKVCSSKSDPDWVINIKLGFLSALQYTWRNDSVEYNSTEHNINGVCDAKYKTGKTDGWRISHRRINLNECSMRTLHPKKSFNLFKKFDIFKSEPFSESIQRCRHVLGTDGQPILVTCRENHNIKPFENSTDILLSIKQQMELDRVVIKKFSNLYDGTYASNEYQYAFMFTENDFYDDTVKEIIYLVRNSKHESVNKTSKKLGRLIKSASYEELKTVLKECDLKEKQYFLSLLPYFLNNNTLKVIFDHYQQKEIYVDLIYRSLYYLPFVENPTLDLLETIQPLLTTASSTPLVYLSVSGLIRNFCIKNQNCYTIPEIQNVINEIESPLKLPLEENNHKTVLFSLLSLENIGFTNSMNTIVEIYKNKNLPKILRIAAIRTYKHMPCRNVQRDLLVDFFENQFYEPQTRIEAYNIIMKCPTHDVYKKILNVLLNEDVNQVTLFVWSYLSQLQDSSSEFSNVVEHILTNNHIKWKYVTKYQINNDSKNNLFNISSTGNVNIITTNDELDLELESFKISTDIDIFGKSIEVIGFDGYMVKRKNISKLDILTKNKVCFETNVEEESKNATENVITNRNLTDELYDHHLYISIFGVELYALNTSNSQDQTMLIDFQRDFEVLDIFYVVSTITGFPLAFSVTADANVHVSTKIDEKFLAICGFDPRNNSILTTSITVNSSLMLNAFNKKIAVNNLDVFNSSVY